MEPKRLTRAFAEEGLKNNIPDVAVESTAANAATYKKGFPAVTMTPIAVGGQPPSGKDMNGVLYELSSHIAYMNKGGQYKFDADFCEEIGGYDIGAIVLSDDGMTEYINTVANNKTNPNTSSSTGWKICSGANPIGKLLADRAGLISASGVRTDNAVDAVKEIAKNSAGDLINKSPLVIYATSRAEFVKKQNTPEMIALPDGAVTSASVEVNIFPICPVGCRLMSHLLILTGHTPTRIYRLSFVVDTIKKTVNAGILRKLSTLSQAV